jgi:AbrB family looped-hinge helix DNA binding protein
LKTKAGRTEKIVKTRIKSHRQIILGEAFGTDRERVKPSSEDHRGEDRKFETSLPGFRFKEEKHEASRYLSGTVARATLSSGGRVTIPRELRARLGIKPGQMVSITAVDRTVHIVPMRRSRKSERCSLPGSKPFVREGTTDYVSRLKQLLETPPRRFGEPFHRRPSMMKKIRKTAHIAEANDD